MELLDYVARNRGGIWSQETSGERGLRDGELMRCHCYFRWICWYPTIELGVAKMEDDVVEFVKDRRGDLEISFSLAKWQEALACRSGMN